MSARESTCQRRDREAEPGHDGRGKDDGGGAGEGSGGRPAEEGEGEKESGRVIVFVLRACMRAAKTHSHFLKCWFLFKTHSSNNICQRMTYVPHWR